MDFTTDTISSDYESIDTHQSAPLMRTNTEPIKMVTLMPSSNHTTSTSSSTKFAMKFLVITVLILLLTLVLLLIVRRYLNAKKWNSNDGTSNAHSIKYVSDKQSNKVHIDMMAEDALNCEKEHIDPNQRRSKECESNGDADAHEDKQYNARGNIFDRVKKQLCRPTLLAAAATTPRYRNLDETM